MNRALKPRIVWATAVCAGVALFVPSAARGQECSNQGVVDACVTLCSVAEDACGTLCGAAQTTCEGLCSAAEGVCGTLCDVADGACYVGCGAELTGCGAACTLTCCPNPFCDCGGCFGDCDTDLDTCTDGCNANCDFCLLDCEGDCAIECDNCRLPCEADCQELCVPYRSIGDSCEPTGLILPCAPGAVCWPAFLGGNNFFQCFPADTDDLFDDDFCLEMYSADLHQGAIDINTALSFGAGASGAVGVSDTFEVGTVYGPDGCYGCYATSCVGVETNIEANVYAAVGFYTSLDDFQGQAQTFFASAGLPGIDLFGFTTGEVFALPSFDFVGTFDTVSFGLGLLPITVGTANCQTILDRVGCQDPNNPGELIVITNNPPSCLSGGPYQAECTGATTTVGVSSGSSDTDGDSITHAWSTDCPGGSFDASTQRSPNLTLTSPPACPVACSVFLTVTDTSGESSSCVSPVTVEDTTPPAVPCPPAELTVECDQEVPLFEPTASDVCDDDLDLAAISGIAPGDCLPEFTISRSFSATDDCGNSSGCTQVVNVVDTTDPTIGVGATGGKVGSNCEFQIPFTASITDNCCVDGTDATTLGLAVNAVSVDGNATVAAPLVSSIQQISETEVLIQGTVLVSDLTGCPAGVLVTAQAADCCGNPTNTSEALVEVEDNIDPVITCPEPTILERGGKLCSNDVQAWLDSTTATDNCDPDVEIVDDSAANGFECGFPYGSTTTVTWTATDDCGNSAQCSSEITIESAKGVDVTGKGSLLIYSKVEIKWDAAGNLTQDTFLNIANDYPKDVFVQLYFVNGDEPADAVFAGDPPVLIERGHSGWNWVDCQIRLTNDQPMYWSALTGGPVGCQAFTILDPGSPPGRPDLDGAPGSRVLRGFVYAWAVNNHGKEIRWNRLEGDAVIINYADPSAWEYNAYSLGTSCVEQGDEPLDCTLFDANGVCCEAEVLPGRLDLDAFQYDFAFDKLLLDFYASGSTALSGGGVSVQVDTDLTLFSVDADLRQDTCGPIVTKAKFDIWNMNEIRFSGTTRCITCWDQTLLGNYDPPNHFLLGNLHTDKGKARIDGIASQVCDANDCTDCAWPKFPACSQDAPLLGVVKKELAFSSGATGRAAAGMTLVGMGEESTSIWYDIIEPPEDLQGKVDNGIAPVEDASQARIKVRK